MTSISASSTNRQYYTPSQLLQDQLQQDVTAGQISATDQTALTSALGNIQTSLQQDGSTTATSTQTGSTTPPTQQDLQDKVSSLIDQQVTAGTLTSSQASELKDVFQQTFSANGTSSVQGHHGGHGHHHGGPPPTDTTDSTTGTDPLTSTSSTTASAATLGSTLGGSTTTSSTQQLVDQFIQSLQAAQSTAYGAAGTATSANLSSLLVNVTA